MEACIQQGTKPEDNSISRHLSIEYPLLVAGHGLDGFDPDLGGAVCDCQCFTALCELCS